MSVAIKAIGDDASIKALTEQGEFLKSEKGVKYLMHSGMDSMHTEMHYNKKTKLSVFFPKTVSEKPHLRANRNYV